LLFNSEVIFGFIVIDARAGVQIFQSDPIGQFNLNFCTISSFPAGLTPTCPHLLTSKLSQDLLASRLKHTNGSPRTAEEISAAHGNAEWLKMAEV